MKNKWILFAALLGAVLLGLTGCGKNQETEKAEKKETEEAIVIKVEYPISRGMGDKTIGTFQEWFEKNYPDAKLELVSSAVSTISDTVKNELKNGKGPDVFVTTEYDSFLQENLLADITDVEALTKYRKSSVRELERDNRVYALPMGGGNLVALHYNKTLFDKYHIEIPSSKETMTEILDRVQSEIEKQNIEGIRSIGASMVYPSQVAVVINSLLVQNTQTSEYLKWVSGYGSGTTSFQDDIFQNYLNEIDTLLVPQEDDEDQVIPLTGFLFEEEDLINTQASSMESFLSGSSFLYLGDVKRCYDIMDGETAYGKEDIGVIGIPMGIEGVSYVSYMDDIYMGVNKNFDNESERKKQIIEEMLNYISSENDIQNIFTFTGEYCSVYLEGESVLTMDDPYFAELNTCLENNYVAQEVSNTPFAGVFGKTIVEWKRDALDKVVTEGKSNVEKVTKILEMYRTEGVNIFEKSAEPIGTSEMYMEYQSNEIRTRETVLGNQIADMARDYMGADFALINAGAIRASVPEGDISVQTINAILPYSNYLVKIQVSGKTLKKAIENAYNVGPCYKSGKFGDISGLKVVIKTKEEGYQEYKKQLEAWEQEHANAQEAECNLARKEIAEGLCEQDEEKLNLEVISLTDAQGNEIEDNKQYTVAIFDYLLKNQDGYSVLGILSDCKEADQKIEIMNRENKVFEGTTEEKIKQIAQNCETGADSLATWIKEGNVLKNAVDGRIEIEDFIYYE